MVQSHPLASVTQPDACEQWQQGDPCPATWTQMLHDDGMAAPLLPFFPRLVRGLSHYPTLGFAVARQLKWSSGALNFA